MLALYTCKVSTILWETSCHPISFFNTCMLSCFHWTNWHLIFHISRLKSTHHFYINAAYGENLYQFGKFQTTKIYLIRIILFMYLCKTLFAIIINMLILKYWQCYNCTGTFMLVISQCSGARPIISIGISLFLDNRCQYVYDIHTWESVSLRLKFQRIL